jgi:integrase
MATFRKLASGRWQAIIRKTGHKPVSETFRTKAAAQDWARTLEEEMAQGLFRDHSAAARMSVEAMLEKYQLLITPRKKSSVKELSRISIITRELGDLSLAALSAESVIDYVDDRLDDVVADTVRKELGTLSHAIDTAMALWGIHLVANPVTVAKGILRVTKTLSAGNQRDRRVEDWELEKIVAFSGSDKLCPVAWFAVETAMRRGELAKAKPEHDLGDRLLVPDTKIGKPREVPLTPRARVILNIAKKDAEERIKAAMEKANPAEARAVTLFNLAADSITQEFNRSKKAAGIADVRFHDLRHEATSRFFEMGLAIEEVASITGHTDWKTLKRYTHIRPSAVARKLI